MEVLVRAESKQEARRTLNRLFERVTDDSWLAGGWFRTSHDPNVAADDRLEEIKGVAGYVVTLGKRGYDALGPFKEEHPSDLLRLDDPRALAFLEEGRCCALWWQKRTRLETSWNERFACGEHFRAARPADRAPPELLAKLRADPRGWWLATIDLHW